MRLFIPLKSNIQAVIVKVNLTKMQKYVEKSIIILEFRFYNFTLEYQFASCSDIFSGLFLLLEYNTCAVDNKLSDLGLLWSVREKVRRETWDIRDPAATRSAPDDSVSVTIAPFRTLRHFKRPMIRNLILSGCKRQKNTRYEPCINTLGTFLCLNELKGSKALTKIIKLCDSFVTYFTTLKQRSINCK